MRDGQHPPKQGKVVYQDERDIKALSGLITTDSDFVTVQQEGRTVKINKARVIKIELQNDSSELGGQ